MLSSVKVGLLLSAGITGAAVLCPLCSGGVSAAGAHSVPVLAEVADTATVRLHISGMTCGSCPVTARLALERVRGVYNATVTLDDSLGVIHYDPRFTSPTQVAAELTRLTGYGSMILPDTTKTVRTP